MMRSKERDTDANAKEEREYWQLNDAFGKKGGLHKMLDDGSGPNHLRQLCNPILHPETPMQGAESQSQKLTLMPQASSLGEHISGGS